MLFFIRGCIEGYSMKVSLPSPTEVSLPSPTEVSLLVLQVSLPSPTDLPALS